MFAGIVTTKAGGKTYRYLKLLEAFRNEAGQSRQRVVATLGNIDTLGQDGVDGIVKSIARFGSNLPTAKDVRSRRSQRYGEVLVLRHLWDRLGLGEFLRDHGVRLRGERGLDAVALALLIILNRSMAPRSKLAITRWHPQIYLPELEGKAINEFHLYRTMDAVWKLKPRIEEHLYGKLTDLFGMKLRLLFYDLTSTYFEGEGPESIATFGHSRDHRRDLHQVMLGLAVTDEGIPIASEVFAGNTADAVTLKGRLVDLKTRFQVEQCVVVGDRGVATSGNLEAIGQAGYDYVVGLRKRKLLEVRELLRTTWEPGEVHETTDPLTFAFEKAGSSGPRHVLCVNFLRAIHDRQSREQLLERTRGELREVQRLFRDGYLPKRKDALIRAAQVLMELHAKKYFELDEHDAQGVSFRTRAEAVGTEDRLDGVFVLKTSVSRERMSAAEVVAGYKQLWEVEDSFRTLKSFVRMRPIFHHKEHRVRCHLFLSVLAYTLEKVLERELRRAKIPMTARRAMEHLAPIHLVTNQVGKVTLGCVTDIQGEAKKILAAVGLKNIPRVLRRP